MLYYTILYYKAILYYNMRCYSLLSSDPEFEDLLSVSEALPLYVRISLCFGVAVEGWGFWVSNSLQCLRLTQEFVMDDAASLEDRLLLCLNFVSGCLR